MNLESALTEIAVYLNLDADDLIRYADEDTIGGYSMGELATYWPSGSLWAGEGKTLYALIRALKPFSVIEFGVHAGCSTTHLRRAAQKNGYGHVWSVDKWEGAGTLIPDTLRSVGDIFYRDALDYAKGVAVQPSAPVDFVFEDLIHRSDEIYDVLNALSPKFTPNTVIVHHDSEHGEDGAEVKKGIELLGVSDYLSLLCGDTDCGLAMYRWSK